jgi:DNA-binding Xre family transcriptional regulator
MNVGRSLRVALAKKDMNQKDLAEKLDVSGAYVNKLANSKSAGMGAVQKLSEFFDMQVSEFLKLGED